MNPTHSGALAWRGLFQEVHQIATELTAKHGAPPADEIDEQGSAAKSETIKAAAPSAVIRPIAGTLPLAGTLPHRRTTKRRPTNAG